MNIAIIGAGLAGLSAAYELREHNVDVFEAADRIGGKLYTVAFNDGPTDMGAEAYLAARSDATEFFEELGLGDRIVYPSDARPAIYSGGKLHPMPSNAVMGIPAASPAVADLVSPEEAVHIDAERNRESLDWQVGEDRNLGIMLRQRYGDNIVDHVVSALLGGVYSCGADALGVRATIPNLAAVLDEQAAAGEKTTLSGAVAALLERRTAPTGPVFATFKGGYADLYETLAEKSGANIHIDSFISEITKEMRKKYDRILIATPAPTTAVLLRSYSQEAAAEVKNIELASSAVVGMTFDSDEGLADVSGILVAADEPDIQAKAFTFSSKKWPHLGQRGGALVRASFGRYGENLLLSMSEADLVDRAVADLHTVTGFTGEPKEVFVQYWYGGLPRYDHDHVARVAKVRELLADTPHIGVAGAWIDGVGVPNVIAGARAAARKLVEN